MGQGSQAAQGALGGAATGAAIGSVVPGIGTGIGAAGGAIVGGLAGWFGGGDEKDEYQRKLEEMAAMYAGMSAPQLGAAAQAAQSSLVGNRAALIAQLEAQARGEGPSAARLQMQQGADQAVQAMTAQASGAGGRGVNAGAAMRDAQGAGAAMMQQNNQSMGIMRAQEQLNAQSQLGQNILQGIQSDNQLSQFNVGQQNQFALQQALMEMQQRGLASGIQMGSIQTGAQMANPGMGTSLLAAGANSIPGLLQMYQAQQQQKMQQKMQQAMQPQPQSNPLVDYQRSPETGLVQGPITSPSQV